MNRNHSLHEGEPRKSERSEEEGERSSKIMNQPGGHLSVPGVGRRGSELARGHDGDNSGPLRAESSSLLPREGTEDL